MNFSGIRPALVLLLALPPASAQITMTPAPGPGTSAPTSGNCGVDTRMSRADFEAMVQQTFQRVLWLSGYRQDTILIFRYDDEGTASMPPNTGINQTSHPAVVAGYDLCEMAHTRDELAMIFGHEIAHLEFNHVERKKAAILTLFKQWAIAARTYDPSFKIPDPVPNTYDELERQCPSCEMIFTLSYNPSRQPINYSRIIAQQITAPLESEADRRGAEYLQRAGSPFRVEQGVSWFAHQQDLMWVEERDSWAGDGEDDSGGEYNSHPSPVQRAYDIKSFLKAQQFAQKIGAQLGRP